MNKEFEFQNKNQEEIIHSKKWNKGNSYRYVLEGTGDIFRELTKNDYYPSYIQEKISRIKNYFQEMEEKRKYFPETGVHPEDSYQFSFENNKDKFNKMISFWKKQPIKNEKQELARQLNISMLTGNFDKAKMLIKQIEVVL